MKIIVGLGNPGRKYKNTPHNIGFEIVDQFAKENNFPEFKLSKKFNALVSEKDDIILAKPETFMNNSGESVAKIINFYKTDDLIVIHDDIDLLLGDIKISEDSGSAGHKGVQSIIKELGSQKFARVRVGIQPLKGKPAEVEKYVLRKFKKGEKPSSTEVIKKLSQLLD